LVGIAGGIRSGAEDLQLGDVLVADQVIGYESAKLRPQGPSSRWEVYRPSAELLTIARHLDPRTWRPRITTPRPADPPGRGVPMIHIGPVLSGEKVLADDAAVAELRTSWPKMIGVEMEGLGAALVLYRANAAFLMVKAVSDYADESKNDGWHKYAADAAARFAVAVLRNEPPAVPVVGVRPPLGRMRNWPTAPTAPPPAVRAPAVRAESGIGRKKVEFCRRLGDDWRELADWFEILPHQRATFSLGNEPRHVWEWLDMRGRLPVLPEALRAIDRTDLADLLEPGASDA
jgi:nucleoside phosphorylase